MVEGAAGRPRRRCGAARRVRLFLVRGGSWRRPH